MRSRLTRVVHCHNRHNLTRATSRLLTLVLGITLCLALMTACGAVATPTPFTVETLRIVGPAELMPLVRELAESFAAARPGVAVEFASAAQADAVNAVQQGSAQLAVVIGRSDSSPRSLTVVEIARQPIAVIVHHENVLRSLSLDMLGNIYSGRISDWRQASGSAMPIMVLTRETGAPIRLRCDEIILGAGSRLTPNALVLPSDDAVVATVARRPETIGYISGAANLTTVRTLVIEGETPAALARGRAYPLWQSVSLVATSPQTANVAALMAYVKSKQGQRIIASLGFGQGGDGP